jgi:hypothetical protein
MHVVDAHTPASAACAAQISAITSTAATVYGLVMMKQARRETRRGCVTAPYGEVAVGQSVVTSPKSLSISTIPYIAVSVYDGGAEGGVGNSISVYTPDEAASTTLPAQSVLHHKLTCILVPSQPCVMVLPRPRPWPVCSQPEGQGPYQQREAKMVCAHKRSTPANATFSQLLPAASHSPGSTQACQIHSCCA